MTRWLARLALGLYPLAFRRRYGDELRALLDQAPVRVLTVLDLVRGALAAHLRPAGETGLVDPADRVRASASGVLACWVVFAAAGFGFYKTTEDASFSAAGHAHRLLGDAHASVQALALVASAAVLLGALPLIITAVVHARRQPRLRLLVSLPALAVTLFAGLTAVLVLVAHATHSHSPTTGGGIAFIGWGIAGLACGAVCVAASRTALFAVPMSRGRLITAFACGALTTAAMAAMALAAALYAIALPLDASHLAGAPNGPLQLISTGVSLVSLLIVMVLAATLASTTTRRGWRAVDQLHAAGSS
jgi:MFS family permease